MDPGTRAAQPRVPTVEAAPIPKPQGIAKAPSVKAAPSVPPTTTTTATTDAGQPQLALEPTIGQKWNGIQVCALYPD